MHREHHCQPVLKSFTIVEMVPGDLNEVIEIEQCSFPTPWSEGLFLQQLHSDFSKAFLATSNNVKKKEVRGYICLWFVTDEVHILNLACHPAFRKQGIASALLEHSLLFSCKRGVKKTFLEVRESNYPALSLYKKYGFKPIGMRKGYYADTHEDAIVMVLKMETEELLKKFSQSHIGN